MRYIYIFQAYFDVYLAIKWVRNKNWSDIIYHNLLIIIARENINVLISSQTHWLRLLCIWYFQKWCSFSRNDVFSQCTPNFVNLAWLMFWVMLEVTWYKFIYNDQIITEKPFAIKYSDWETWLYILGYLDKLIGFS